MTQRVKAALGLTMLVGTLPMLAQEPLTTTTKTVKIAPGETKTTVITKEAGAKDKSKKTAKGRKHAVKAESGIAHELHVMHEEQEAQKARLATQQAEIDALTRANAAKDAALAQASADAAAASAAAAAAQTQATAAAAQAQSTSVQEKTDVQVLTTQVATVSTKEAATEKDLATTKVEVYSPLAMHYKNVRITPGGFMAFEGVYRTRSINSDIGTPFNLTPYPGSNQGHISELNLTGRQSRPQVFVEATAGKTKLSAFLETDFLSAGVTSNNNQTNSYTLRVRQAWGKVEAPSGFTATFGQTWTLMTENVKGTDAKTEKLPSVIDPVFVVGWTYGRQATLRLQQRFAKNAVTIAVSAENAQTQLTATNAPANFIFGGAGQAGGTYNAYNGTYANNVVPDFGVKMAIDSKYSHIELGGIARFFRDEYYPLVLNPATGVTASYSTALSKNTKAGGGVYASARLLPSKYFEVAVQGMAGPGAARYSAAQLGDVTVRPDGTLEPIKNYHGLFSMEAHPNKKLDIQVYYGGEYNQRTVYINNAGALVGYGVPSVSDTGCYTITAPAVGTGGTGVTGSPATTNCNSNTKVIEQGVLGYTYKIISDPKWGMVRLQMDYSYIQKYGWAGVASGAYPALATTNSNGKINYYPAGVTFVSPRATNNVVNVGLRYYLP